MWELVWTFILAQLWICSFFWSSLHLYIFFSLIYALYYFFGSAHREGTRSWTKFRSMGIWDTLRKRWFYHSWHQCNGWKSFERHGEAYLFVVHPQTYGVASCVSFGLHGSKNTHLTRFSPLIMLAPYLFWIPLLTDVLQWMGGIIHTTDQLQDALNHKKSVVWAPMGGGTMTSHDIAHGVALQEEILDIRIFEWIAEYGSKCRFSIVPVYHTGEELTYFNASTQLPLWIQSCQQWFHRLTGHDVFLPIFGLFGTCLPRRVELRTKVGEPISTMNPILDGKGIHTGQYESKTAHHLRDEFRVEFNKLSAPDAGETPFQIISQ